MSKAKEFEAAANELAEAYIKVSTLICEQTIPQTKEDALAQARAFAIESQVSGTSNNMALSTVKFAMTYGATADEVLSVLEAPRRVLHAVRAAVAKRNDN